MYLSAGPRYKRGGKWVRTSGDDIPERAVVAGESSSGGPLYVGRSEHEGGLFPGKVNPSHSCCYIAWGGEEHSKEEYDVSLYITYIFIRIYEIFKDPCSSP